MGSEMCIRDRFLFALTVAPVLALTTWVLGKLARKRFSILYLLIVTTVVAGLCSVAIALSQKNTQFGEIMALALLSILGSAPVLGAITFLRVSYASFRLVQAADAAEQGAEAAEVALIEKKRTRFWRTGVAWITWLSTMYWTWKVALEIQAREYAKLPTTDPNCYVSSAAAHGHPRWVGSLATDSEDRDSATNVNLQMKRLKFLEFGLRAAAPGIHSRIRSFYNSVGPRLANLCQSNVWFADLTFLVLKPVEWAAILVRVLAGVPKDAIDSLYRDRRSSN